MTTTHQSQHTPGPWTYYKTLDGKHHVDLPGDGAADVVGANAPNNARLIAAAPELLEALKAIVDTCDTSPSNRPSALDVILSRIARQVIAKAEGQ
jgi:hypothetical protein